MVETGPVFNFFYFVAAVIVAIWWGVLFSAILGIRSLLRDLLAAQQRQNALMERHLQAMEWVATNTEKLPPPGAASGASKLAKS